MSVVRHMRVARVALSLVVIAALQACVDRTTEPVGNLAAPRPTSSATRLTCVADVRARSVACSAPKIKANADAGPIVLGGQGTYVQLTADSSSYDAEASRFYSRLKVQNLTGQTLGTLDGSTITGVKVFLNSVPVSSDGSTVSLEDPDGFQVFTATSQPFMHYLEILDAFGGTSRSKLWSFHVANSAQYFTFTVLVSADSPEIDLPLRWDVERGFATYADLFVYGIDSRNVFAFGTQGYGEEHKYTVDRFDGTAWHSVNTDLGVNVKAAWASSASDLWVAGTSGFNEFATVAHYNGSSWTTMSLGAGVLTGIWGSAPNDVYAVGDASCCLGGPIVQHWDGSAWTAFTGMPIATYIAIGGSASNNVWAIGRNDDNNTVVAHWDGADWTTVPMPSSGNDIIFSSVYVAGSEVWAVGDGGSAHYLGGGEWQVFVDGSVLAAVHGTDASNVWAVGFSVLGGIETETEVHLSTVLRWNSNTQAWVAGPEPPLTLLSSIWTSGPNNAWAIGEPADFDRDGVPLHWDGTSWAAVGSHLGAFALGEQSLNAVFGLAANDVWAVGTAGQILQNTGTGWHQVGTQEPITWRGIWGSGVNDIWIVGDSAQIRHWTASGLTAVPTPSGIAGQSIRAVYGFAANDVYAATNGAVMIHFDGTAWTQVSHTFSMLRINAIWGSGPHDIWAVGHGSTAIAHSTDGINWSETGSPYELTAVHGIPGDSYPVIVGTHDDVMGVILRFDEGWFVQSEPDVALFGLFTDGPANHLLAVGDRGTILRYTGSQWVQIASGVSASIYGVWMSGLNNIFTVGDGEFLAHGKP